MKTYVWVANRDSPLQNSSFGVLRINPNGNIALLDHSLVSSDSIWSPNQSTSGNAVNTVAQLLDSGNFVLRLENDEDPENYLWQSFDYPTDTLLPGMRLGWDSRTGMNRYLTSWKTSGDPSSGDYSFKLDIQGFPEFYLIHKEVRDYRSGPWNGIRFSGVPEMKGASVMNFVFVHERNEVSYSFVMLNKSIYSRLIIQPFGALQRLTWIENSQTWSVYWYAPKDQCDGYRECGHYGICDPNVSPVCKCPTGFVPKNQQAWNLRDGSDGCVRKNDLGCGSDGFLSLKNMKLPESWNAFIDKTMSLGECAEMCKKNCSCTAYANMDITGSGSGCVIWVVDLWDMRQYAVSEGGQDLYLRVAAADLEQGASGGSGNGSNNSGQIIMIVAITVGTCVVLSGLVIFFLGKRRSNQNALANSLERKGERSQDFFFNEAVIPSRRDYSGETTTDELELPLLDFSTLVMATNNFSDANKLGQGGFGCVYKGMLVEGQDIAVKRLSKNSGQGTEEFKNEVRLIARLQHRNLVRLLGCCIEMEEKLLIYEFMENKSLDSILFKKEKSSLLNWQTRFNIICGIARGLLYLHQDSRFRIVHRDLKASNILLDKEMNPKISDFGMARIFGGDQTEAETKRVVGTYGYMSPEYAMDGIFSVKSDVFSFGVLVLEIVSGIKNRGFYNTNNEINLLGHAWRLWKEGKGLELMDPLAGDKFSQFEVLRCLQVSLLCVQEQADDRPTMSTVLLMLSSETAPLAQPKYPGFCLGKRHIDTDSSSGKQDESFTINDVTVTMLDAR